MTLLCVGTPVVAKEINLPRDPVEIASIAIAYPHIRAFEKRGRNLIPVQESVSLLVASQLVESVAKQMPRGISTAMPLPHRIPAIAEGKDCHVAALLTYAQMMRRDPDYLPILETRNALRYILGDEEPLCGYEPYKEADVILYMGFSGIDTLDLKGLFKSLTAVALAGMSGPTTIPLGPGLAAPFRGMTAHVVLVENQTRRILASDFKSTEFSTDEDDMDELAGSLIECLVAGSGKTALPKPSYMMEDDHFDTLETRCETLEIFEPYHLPIGGMNEDSP